MTAYTAHHLRRTARQASKVVRQAEIALDMSVASIENAAPFGGVPERPKGSDCKSDVIDFEGSNPSPSTRFKREPQAPRV